MADNYLITGYWGEPHVTVENDRGINAAMFGTGRFVLPVGEQFRAEYIGNNTIRIYNGKLMNNGAAAGIPVGEYVDVLIANAGQGKNRNDLIVFQYELDSSTMVEKGTFVVIQGEEVTGTAYDPILQQQDLLSNEAVKDQMALWRVPVSGVAIATPIKVFEVKGMGKLHFKNITVPAGSFVSNSTYADFPYRAAIALNGVDSTMVPDVVLSVSDAISGNFAPVAETYDGGVYVYSSSPPESAVNIPTILCWAGDV